jgi:hypothetical protein
MKHHLEQSNGSLPKDVIDGTPDPSLHAAVTPHAVARLLQIEERCQQPDGSEAKIEPPSMLHRAIRVLELSPVTIADEILLVHEHIRYRVLRRAHGQPCRLVHALTGIVKT